MKYVLLSPHCLQFEYQGHINDHSCPFRHLLYVVTLCITNVRCLVTSSWSSYCITMILDLTLITPSPKMHVNIFSGCVLALHSSRNVFQYPYSLDMNACVSPGSTAVNSTHKSRCCQNEHRWSTFTRSPTVGMLCSFQLSLPIQMKATLSLNTVFANNWNQLQI